jgi:hypothetical protein
MAPRLSDDDYFRAIEGLAHVIVEEAASEGWLEFGEQGQTAATPLRRAVNALATELRFVHYPGDGCLDTFEG